MECCSSACVSDRHTRDDFVLRKIPVTMPYNLFNLDRHLHRRDIFKQNRSTALTEWRQLVA